MFGCLSDGNSGKQQQASWWTCISGLLLMFQISLVFTQAQRFSKAMLAHEHALEWQELFDLAARSNLSEDDVVNTGYRIAGLYSFSEPLISE